MSSEEGAPIGRKLLAAVLGVIATAGLLTTVPADESGQKVQVTVRPSGEATVTHVAGPEYLVAYRDLVGVWTICDGLTKGVRKGMTESRAGCQRRLEAELVDSAEHVLACLPALRAPGGDYQRWAFVSLAHNIGWPSVCSSTAAKRYRAGNWTGACDAFLMWDKAGRPLRQVRGLKLRRLREREICLTAIPGGFSVDTLAKRVEIYR